MTLGNLSEEQFAKVYGQLIIRINEDPITNLVKASGFLDLDPTPAQEVILKVIFGKSLDPLTKKEVKEEYRVGDAIAFRTVLMTEFEIYEFLTESPYDPEKLQGPKINKINLICGRRSGKTLLSAIIAIYCAISTNWKPFLKKTPFATVLIMSHSRDFSDEVLEVIRSMIEMSEVLTLLINKNKKNTSSTMNLKIPWIVGNSIQYSRVQIKTAAASSKTTRGVAACAILCDEIAYWNLEETMKETDAKIMKAVRPAMKQFGSLAMLIKLSSPGIRQGVLYSEYKKDRAKELPTTYAVFKAPTWVMNTLIPDEELVEEHKLDPDGFDVEYRSNFADSLSNFIVPEFIDMSVQKKVQFLAPEKDGTKYYAAIDAAYKKDHFTFSVVAYANGRLKQYMSKGWEGSKQSPVRAFEVAEFIRQICREFNIDEVGADQFSYQPLKEIFEKYSMSLVEYTFTPMFKKKIYFNLKKLIHSQQADLLDNETQTRELKELIVEQAAGGQIKISHPQGGTDDYADSLAISSYLATEGVSTGQFEIVSNSTMETYGVKTDRNGKSFTAPSADMLVSSGHLPPTVRDNSMEFVVHPETGKLVRRSDLDDEDEDTGPQFIF